MINNSIRHGEAKNIGLKINQNTQSLKLEYEDDGKGFDATQLEKKKGLGLKNIDSRLHMIGADISYESAPGQGVKALIQLNKIH